MRTPIEDVGIYESTSSILSLFAPGQQPAINNQPHNLALWGWGTVLSELHYQYRYIPEWKFTSSVLNTLKVLIIPNSEVFDPSDVPTLTTWVNNGGALIVTGDSGNRLGEEGNFAISSTLTLSSLTGVSSMTGAPATQTEYVGKGYVRFISSNYGLSYWNDSASDRTTLYNTISTEMSNAFAAVAQEPAVVSSNAARTTGLTLYGDPAWGRLLLDVNNLNITLQGTTAATVTPTSTTNVTVYKPSWWNQYGDKGLVAYAVSQDGAVTLPAPTVYSNYINLTIPPLTFYTSIILSPVMSMGTAKTVPDGGGALIGSEVVTAVFSNYFYVEEPTRTKGIQVQWTGTPVSVGQVVTVAGTMTTTADGERAIVASSVESSGTGSINPLDMSGRNVGGVNLTTNGTVSQMGVNQGVGPNNVGILVRVSGNVSGDGSGYCVVDDGDLINDASGAQGVRVLLQGLTDPGFGTFVTVTGISSLKTINGVTYRCILPRTQADLQVTSRGTLVGEWNFAAANPLNNQAPGYNWSTMAVTSGVVSSGTLLLRRYSAGGWKQGYATTMLQSDLGPSGYFTEMTQVAWLYWPNFSSTQVGRIMGIFKFNTSSYNAANAVAGLGLSYGGSSAKWQGYDGWEFFSGGAVQSASQNLSFAPTSDPPTTGYIKIAQVLKNVGGGSYQLTMYWDTGSGAVQLGNSVTVPASQVSSFGQYNTNDLVNASGGLRYDGFGIMDLSTTVPASMGSIYFQEVRLYAGALGLGEINALAP